MKCTGETNLEGFNPSKYKAKTNLREEMFAYGYSIVREEVDRLTDQGWSFGKKGVKHRTVVNYEAANRYYYIINLVIVIRNYLDLIGKSNTNCNYDLVKDKFKLDCVENNLMCLGKKYMTPYNKFWETLLKEFGINKTIKDCDSCCYGIGGMVINKEACDAFEIGECK